MVSVFRWIIDQTLRLLTIVYPFLGYHPLWLLPYVLGTILVAWLIGRLIKADLTDLVGSGVPQIEAILLGQHRMNWWTVLWRKFVSGLLTICPGLFLGREGPCIQIGPALVKGFPRRSSNCQKKMSTFFSNAVWRPDCPPPSVLPGRNGLPLRRSHPPFPCQSLGCGLCFRYRGRCRHLPFFGTQPCLYLPIKTGLPTGAYPWLIVLGVAIGALAFLFQYFIFNLKWWYRKFTILPNYYHSILPLLLVIPVGLWNPHILGG